MFTSELWKHIPEKLGIERRLNTAFQPQTDGQTEQTNGILEKYLRAYIHYQQDNWNEVLPIAEFAYNNGYQEIIKTTVIYANYGISPEHQLITHMMTEKITSASGMKELHNTLRAEMATAQLRHKENYDRDRKPDPNLKSGDMVCLLPHNVHTTRPLRKLDYKKIGPFKIFARIETSAYKLAIPPSMKIHNTIKIFLLEPYQDNGFPSQIQEPTTPMQIEGEEEHELDELIDSRLHYNNLQYRAQWEGYGPEEDKVWDPAENFNNVVLAIELFHNSYSGKPRVATLHNQQVILRTSHHQGGTVVTNFRRVARLPARCSQRYAH